jgi:hypothetical protein
MFENKNIWQVLHSTQSFGDPYWAQLCTAQNMTDIVGPGDMYFDVQLPERHVRFGEVSKDITDHLLGTSVIHTQNTVWDWFLDRNLTDLDPGTQLIIRRPIIGNAPPPKNFGRGIDLDKLAGYLDKHNWIALGYFFDIDPRMSTPEISLQKSIWYSRRGLDGDMKLFDVETNIDILPTKGIATTTTWLIAYKNKLKNFYTLAINPYHINTGNTINQAEEVGNHVLFPFASHRDRQFEMFLKPEFLGISKIVNDHIFVKDLDLTINIGKGSILNKLSNFVLPELDYEVSSNWTFNKVNNSVTLNKKPGLGYLEIKINFGDLSKPFAVSGERGTLIYQYILVGE